MRISDWSSDVCSSDLTVSTRLPAPSKARHEASRSMLSVPPLSFAKKPLASTMSQPTPSAIFERPLPPACLVRLTVAFLVSEIVTTRSEEHTSELQSLMRKSYDVFCLKKKNQKT